MRFKAEPHGWLAPAFGLAQRAFNRRQAAKRHHQGPFAAAACPLRRTGCVRITSGTAPVEGRGSGAEETAVSAVARFRGGYHHRAL